MPPGSCTGYSVLFTCITGDVKGTNLPQDRFAVGANSPPFNSDVQNMETTTSADKSPCDIRGYERVFVQWDVGFCLLLLSIAARRGSSQHVAFYGNLT
jgi:hypothetical protein